jgi:hypothetical protein
MYLEAHASNVLSSTLSIEIKDEIEIEYGLLDKVNLLWESASSNIWLNQ